MSVLLKESTQFLLHCVPKTIKSRNVNLRWRIIHIAKHTIFIMTLLVKPEQIIKNNW